MFALIVSFIPHRHSSTVNCCYRFADQSYWWSWGDVEIIVGGRRWIPTSCRNGWKQFSELVSARWSCQKQTEAFKFCDLFVPWREATATRCEEILIWKYKLHTDISFWYMKWNIVCAQLSMHSSHVKRFKSYSGRLIFDSAIIESKLFRFYESPCAQSRCFRCRKVGMLWRHQRPEENDVSWRYITMTAASSHWYDVTRKSITRR